MMQTREAVRNFILKLGGLYNDLNFLMSLRNCPSADIKIDRAKKYLAQVIDDLTGVCAGYTALTKKDIFVPGFADVVDAQLKKLEGCISTFSVMATLFFGASTKQSEEYVETVMSLASECIQILRTLETRMYHPLPLELSMCATTVQQLRYLELLADTTAQIPTYGPVGLIHLKPLLPFLKEEITQAQTTLDRMVDYVTDAIMVYLELPI